MPKTTSSEKQRQSIEIILETNFLDKFENNFVPKVYLKLFCSHLISVTSHLHHVVKFLNAFLKK